MKVNSTRKIPFFNYADLYGEDEMTAMRDICSRGAFIMQEELAEFEVQLSEYTGAMHAVGVANATDGLQMALHASGIRSGDEVIFCSHTMVATASAIYFTGAKPVPVEAGPDHMIDPDAIQMALTPFTKAIVPTQLNGRTADMDAITAIADMNDLLIFEDAAQALGSKFRDRFAGSFGKAACISFYPAKILGCYGDGGVVLTRDESLYEKLLLLRDHGRDASGEIQLWGFNSRLDNLQAAVLNQKFARLEDVIARRRHLAMIYHERLGHLDDLLLPPGPDDDPAHFDVYQNYEIEAGQRDGLKSFLEDHGIGTAIQWGGKAVHQIKKLGFNQSLPFTERLFKRMLLLPLNMSLTDEDVHYVCEHIEDFYY